MKVRIPNAEIIRKPTVPCKIGFVYSRQFADPVNDLLESAYRKGMNQLSVELSLPHRSRSTGPRSQNNRIWGHCEDIAEQLIDPESGKQKYTREEVKDAMMRFAVAEGYPTKWSDLHGEVIPIPTREASVEEAQIVLEVIQRFADRHALWLTEYDLDGVPYRSVGGRTREEMEALDGKA